MNDPTADTPPPGTATVVLGVTGSIAAYKAADLAGRMVRRGLDVHVIMTENATKLVQPQTFLTLSRNPVTVDLWSSGGEWEPGHIALAERARLLAVAPATANIIAKMAAGIADDPLSTFAVANSGPVVVAPAMNPAMWSSSSVSDNCEILRGRGVQFVGPETGRVACGTSGKGRFASVEHILHAVQAQLALAEIPSRNPCRVLVTAGPTREMIDPVRFISNRSSGKMGYALADAAVAAGHETTLITGPVSLAPPPGCRTVSVLSAEEMSNAVKDEFPRCDVLVMVAAVADFRPAECPSEKIGKSSGMEAVTLERTEDILTAVAGMKRPGQMIMGFAADTEHVQEAAVDKLKRKELDWIVANDVSRSDVGLGSDDNEVTVISRDGQVTELPKMSKLDLAVSLVSVIDDKRTELTRGGPSD